MINNNANISILLVEDDDGHADLVTWNLEKTGIENPLYRVKNGQQAVDFVFKNGQYSGVDVPSSDNLIMLLDINMPIMDGYEVLKSIRANDDTKLLPIIMLTTAGDKLEVTKCHELGCNLFIKKSVDHAALVITLQQLGAILTAIRIPLSQVSISE